MASLSTSSWFSFFLATLAVWRVAHLLHAEDGPFDMLVRLRCVLGQGFWGTLMDCFHCLSIWIAAPAAWFLGQSWPERLVMWLALSGSAIFWELLHALLEKWNERLTLTPLYTEDPPQAFEEDGDGVLRK